MADALIAAAAPQPQGILGQVRNRAFLTANQEHVDRYIREGAELIEIELSLVTLDDILLHERRHAPPAQSPWAKRAGRRIGLVSIDTECC